MEDLGGWRSLLAGDSTDGLDGPLQDRVDNGREGRDTIDSGGDSKDIEVLEDDPQSPAIPSIDRRLRQGLARVACFLL